MPPGSILAGFSITFDYLGTGTPGSQVFDIINPDTFVTVDNGVTRNQVVIQQIPTLSQWAIMLLSSLIGLLAIANNPKFSINFYKQL
ncbi:IPTL-CTERM sorting domain-containing protein [Methyloprofundus sp.]|uniref:IPTL-CTERM sorting domain-containing protein n=1 Tax=Methyloprofundus sp. TaxID=2020875 RepID=UPI003D144356